MCDGVGVGEYSWNQMRYLHAHAHDGGLAHAHDGGHAHAQNGGRSLLVVDERLVRPRKLLLRVEQVPAVMAHREPARVRRELAARVVSQGKRRSRPSALVAELNALVGWLVTDESVGAVAAEYLLDAYAHEERRR